MSRLADPKFVRLTELLLELQRANALQIRIERGKDNSETVVMGFPPQGPPELAANVVELRSLLNLTRPAQGHTVRYGGYSGRGDEIAITTRSMLQVMIELGVTAQVPEGDVTGGRATAGLTSASPAEAGSGPLVGILSGSTPPSDAYVAVSYKGRWFWIADTDVRSKLIFGGVMLLFSISEVGAKSAAPVVTVPAN